MELQNYYVPARANPGQTVPLLFPVKNTTGATVPAGSRTLRVTPLSLPAMDLPLTRALAPGETFDFITEFKAPAQQPAQWWMQVELLDAGGQRTLFIPYTRDVMQGGRRVSQVALSAVFYAAAIGVGDPRYGQAIVNPSPHMIAKNTWVEGGPLPAALTAAGVTGKVGTAEEAAEAAEAEARLQPVYLSDVLVVASDNAYAPIHVDGTNYYGHNLTINGRNYYKGLWMHPFADRPAETRFRLDGKYARFRADVGLDDANGALGTVTFEVYADGVKLFDSGKVGNSEPAKVVDVDVTGKQELRLVVTNAGDGEGWDWADWGDAHLLRA